MLIVDPNKKDSKEFIDEITAIQRAKTTSEIMNITKLNEEIIELVSDKAKNFYINCFSNNAQYLQEKLEKLSKEDTIF